VLNGTRRTFQLAESEISVDKIIRLSSIGDPVIYDIQSNITLQPDSEGLFKSYDFSGPEKEFEVKQRLRQLPSYMGRASLSSSSSSGRNPPQTNNNNNINSTLQGYLKDTNFILVILILLFLVVLFVVSFFLYEKNLAIIIIIWSIVVIIMGLVFMGWMRYLLVNITTKSTLPRGGSVSKKRRDINITKTETNGPSYVSTVAELAKLKKKRLPINGRDILVLYHKQEIVALDAVCYHFGGPLVEGDIEDIGDISCIKCPWHQYKIDIHTGEGINYTMGNITSKGPRQRVHEVKVINNEIFVSLNTDPIQLASDEYAYQGLYKLPTSKKPPRNK